MDTAQFLARVVAPGNFLCIGYKRGPLPADPFIHAFFPEGEFSRAAGLLRWASGKGWDAYHAQASFKQAIADGADNRGQPKFKGLRKIENAQQVKSFWMDLDVKREGDKKQAGGVWATRPEAIGWLAAFIKATGLPKPNMLMDSGYGFHVYWILEDAMPVADWLPYGDALRSALIDNGYRGEAGISSDAVRVLRPAGVMNHKNPAAPAPVVPEPKVQGGDIPNATMLAALRPFLGRNPLPTVVAAPGASQGSPGAASALAGGNVSPIFGNTALALPNMAQAATANLAPVSFPRDRLMSRIATECRQVAFSLANGGAQDNRPIWYLGHLTLAHKCADGAQYVHPLSSGHPSYTAAETDREFARVETEHQRKPSGPPTCRLYAKERPAVCQACPHFNKIRSPWDLGVDSGDLPKHYRRASGAAGPVLQIEERDKDGNPSWRDIMNGDFYSPHLDDLPNGGYAISFRHERVGKVHDVYADLTALKSEKAVIHSIFTPQKIVFPENSELPFRRFVVAWIDELLAAGAARDERISPFGWVMHEGKITGFALAGTLYRPGGGTEAAPGGDPQAIAWYKPQGQMSKWREAFDLVTKDRPDLQAIVACTVAAPLMQFTGQAGACVSAYGDSGKGKSSAMKVAAGFWGSLGSMSTMRDTPNAVMGKMGLTRNLPVIWDEARVKPSDVPDWVDMIFTITGGRGRARMSSDTSLRAVGEWKTILTIASNRPVQDYMVEHESTAAGALRVFEFPVVAPATKSNLAHGQIIEQAMEHYGRAGVVYAEWLGRNAEVAKKAVALAAEDLSLRLGAEADERFFIAVMSTMLVGAKVANHLGLTSFDVPALKEFLCKTFTSLRDTRAKTVSMTGKSFDVAQLLGLYVAENMGKKLITDNFASKGPKKPVAIKWQPGQGQGVAIHIATDDALMRISRTDFNAWCRSKNLAPTNLADVMKQRFGMLEDRYKLAAGTPYAGPQSWCFQFSLNHPDLEGFLMEPRAEVDLNAVANATPGGLPTVAQRLGGQLPNV